MRKTKNKKSEEELDNKQQETADNSNQEEEQEKEPYAYDEGEFNPDKWQDKDDARQRRKREIHQKGLALVAGIMALVLFGALFVVEFRSLIKVKDTGDAGYAAPEKKEEKVEEKNKIIEVLETGNNYTIYLDTETGVEYMMFKVGSSIQIQPLINTDGTYKKYVEPTQAPTKATEASTKQGWFDSLKPTSTAADKGTKTGKPQPSTQAAQTNQAGKGTEAPTEPATRPAQENSTELGTAVR